MDHQGFYLYCKNMNTGNRVTLNSKESFLIKERGPKLWSKAVLDIQTFESLRSSCTIPQKSSTVALEVGVEVGDHMIRHAIISVAESQERLESEIVARRPLCGRRLSLTESRIPLTWFGNSEEEELKVNAATDHFEDKTARQSCSTAADVFSPPLVLGADKPEELFQENSHEHVGEAESPKLVAPVGNESAPGDYVHVREKEANNATLVEPQEWYRLSHAVEKEAPFPETHVRKSQELKVNAATDLFKDETARQSCSTAADVLSPPVVLGADKPEELFQENSQEHLGEAVSPKLVAPVGNESAPGDYVDVGVKEANKVSFVEPHEWNRLLCLSHAVEIEHPFLGTPVRKSEIYVGLGQVINKKDIVDIWYTKKTFIDRAERLFRLIAHDGMQFYSMKTGNKKLKPVPVPFMKSIEVIMNAMPRETSMNITTEVFENFFLTHPAVVRRRVKAEKEIRREHRILMLQPSGDSSEAVSSEEE